MISQLLFGVVWLLAPHPVLDDANDFLPLTQLNQASHQIWLISHQHNDWALAFYLPPDLDLQNAAPFTRNIDEQHRDLLGVRVPRLVLRNHTDTNHLGGLEVSILAVDVSEFLFKALLDAYLDIEIVRRGGPKLAEIDVRAAEIFADLPPEQQRSAYLDALTDFGAHILSLANEIGRSFARQSDPEGLCALAESSGGLFKLWRIAFEQGQFFGRATTPRMNSGISSPNSDLTKRALEPSDKRWLLDEVLDGRFTGDPSRDFAPFCASQS